MGPFHRAACALLLAIAGIAAPALAAPPQVAGVEASRLLAEHLAVPFASGLAGATDAPVFAWVENAAGVRNVWVARAGSPARRRTGFTQDDGVEISGLALDPAGRRLVFVRGGDAEFPGGGVPNTGQAPSAPEQTLHLLAVAGDEAPRAIGRGHGAAFAPDGQRIAFVRGRTIMLWRAGDTAREAARLSGNAGDLSWSPDGTRLLFRERRPGHSIVGLLDLAAGTLRYLGATLGHSADPVFAPDGSAVAFIQVRDPPAASDHAASFWSLRIADLATGAVRIVWTAPAGQGGRYYGTRGRNLFWTATGNLLFPWERSGWLHIYAVPAAGGGAPRDLTPDANEVENFRPTPGGRALVYTANPGDLDSRTLWRVPLAGGAPEQLTRADVFAFFPVFAGERLAATITDARRPAYMVLVEGMAPLGPAPAIDAYPRPEPVVFTAADGMAVHGQLFRAAGPGPHPALIFAHGGPRRQMLPGFHPLYYYHNSYVRNQEFAARGYTVLSVNYRSGTNYGRAFREAEGTGRRGAAEYRDILAGARWLAARADVDRERIGIWGGSWGGYLAALALARDSDLFAAGVDLHGVHAMVRPVGDTVPPGEALRVQQLQWDSSPLGAIETWRSPVLIVHGDDDRNVDYRQSLLLARELSARAVPFEELAFPNERHDFFRYDHWLATYLAAGDFLDRHLKGSE